MPSFESPAAVFVHVPKAAGMSIYYTAKAAGLVLREAPPLEGHKPAAWFGINKPTWCVIRHPLEWYPSCYRYHLDTNWRWLPERRGQSFNEWFEPGLYSRILAELAVGAVVHRYRFEAAQAGYLEHVGPGELLRENVSRSVRPELSAGQRWAIERADVEGFSLYETAQV